MPLDLKEPEGWRLSSLRKILLLRFRNRGLQEKGRPGDVCQALGCKHVPSRGLGQRAGLDEGRGDPRLTAVDGHDGGGCWKQTDREDMGVKCVDIGGDKTTTLLYAV